MLTGSIVAMVTPFKRSKIDYNAVDKLLDMHLEAGTDGILLCGTTGESPALANDEREFFIKYCINRLEKKVPVIIGSGTNNLNKTIALTSNAENEGADYALVITPYYNKPTQEGLFLYFSKIMENVKIPVIIYNVPGRTGVNINSETTLKLAEKYENIAGIKEASGNLVQASEIIRNTPDNFAVYSGEDALNMPLYACGAKGSISVTANILPKKLKLLADLCLAGEFEKARELHLELLFVNQAMFWETNPIPVKEALALMGLIEAEFKMPMCRMKEENLKKLKEMLSMYKLV